MCIISIPPGTHLEVARRSAGLGSAFPWSGRVGPGLGFLLPAVLALAAAGGTLSAGGTGWPAPVALELPRNRSHPPGSLRLLDLPVVAPAI